MNLEHGVSAIPVDLSKLEPANSDLPDRIMAQKFLHGLCAHFRAF